MAGFYSGERMAQNCRSGEWHTGHGCREVDQISQLAIAEGGSWDIGMSVSQA